MGGTYVRFDAPKAKIRKSWPGVRGTPYVYIVFSQFSYPLTNSLAGFVKSITSELLLIRFLITSAYMCVFSPTRHDLASLRGVTCDLGLHAVHSCDLQHHSVSVPWAGVRNKEPDLRGMAAHPHHGHLQHVGLCWQGQ